MTTYRKLADAILDDLDTYGPKSEDLRSVAKWHQDLVEHYISLENDSFAEIVKTECFHEADWTEAILKQDAWTLNYRNLLLEQDSITAWIEKCTHMQMNAILHLYRALKSVRVAFAVAHLMENVDDDYLDDQLEIIIQWITDNSELAYFFVYRIIHLFKLYYGIHLDEHGKIIRVDTDDADALFIGKKLHRMF